MEGNLDIGTPAAAGDKARLLARIGREWSALMDVIEPLSDEQMKVPGAGGWSAKDHLAHLTAWEQYTLLHHVQGQPAHEVLQVDAAAFDSLDEDGLNAIIHERYRDRSLADVLAALHRSHGQLLAALEGASPPDLMETCYPDDPESRPLLEWVGYNTYDHYQEHRLTIEATFSR
jgi:hypothetical protein